MVVSRAVAPLKDLWRWSKPLIRRNKTAAGTDNPNGLICLKGGDLRNEIFESGLKKIAQAWSVNNIFPEPAFEDKYVVYVPKLI